MPIILDTNCFANVFSAKSTKHEEFKPVLEWVKKGKGIFVYGGSKYIQELRTASKYLRIFRLLKDIKKIHEGNKEEIDKWEKEIKEKIKDQAFNDHHLSAIVIVTKCRIICSDDITSIKFVTNRDLYPKGIKKPKYYTGKKNKDLLCDKYIDDTLEPLCQLNKENKEKFENILNRILT